MLSVLISVYAKELPDYLDQALVSVWYEQTVKPSQIVLVKDGVLPVATELVIERWVKQLGSVLTVVEIEKNVGLGAALNEGLKHCKHSLVARMDTDDIALSTRFERQIDFMLSNPEIVASSAQIEEWDTNLETQLGIRKLPLSPAEVALFAKRRSPLSHPVAIFRKDIILEVGGYPPLRKAQDFALWSLLLVKGYKLANIPDMLLKMRTGNELIQRRGWGYFKQELQLYSFQKSIGFLSQRDYMINVYSKAILRLSPNFIKILIYRLAR